MKALSHLLFFLLPVAVQAQYDAGAGKILLQDSVALFEKTNSVQIANYTPKPGSEGRNVSFLIELLSLGRLNRTGGDGSNGPDLTVQLKTVHLYGQQLIKLMITSTDSIRKGLFYINPVKGQLKIITDGSDGGQGGVSAKGNRGDPGRGGRGGHITILVDSNAAAYIRCTCLVFSNNDGNGRDKTSNPEDELLLSNGQLLQPFNKTPVWKLVKLADE